MRRAVSAAAAAAVFILIGPLESSRDPKLLANTARMVPTTNCDGGHYLRRSINNPAAIASMARTVLTVAETRMLSSGKRPVRINQRASRTIPRFLPARVLVRATYFHSSTL